ncbi:uncharacterized protein LOC142325605 isoform X2 [Lycorma delicatula]|uniref:uncharacterized protein LOC142325605 isoform X2 n=1 Tax=Lycorma delicatula TaxID=130591 RepID=UPI003F511461
MSRPYKNYGYRQFGNRSDGFFENNIYQQISPYNSTYNQGDNGVGNRANSSIASAHYQISSILPSHMRYQRPQFPQNYNVSYHIKNNKHSSTSGYSKSKTKFQNNKPRGSFNKPSKLLSSSLNNTDKQKSLESEPIAEAVDSSNDNEKERLKKVEEDKLRLVKLLSTDKLPSVEIDNSLPSSSILQDDENNPKKREYCLKLPTLELTENDYKEIGSIAGRNVQDEDDNDDDDNNKTDLNMVDMDFEHVDIEHSKDLNTNNDQVLLQDSSANADTSDDVEILGVLSAKETTIDVDALEESAENVGISVESHEISDDMNKNVVYRSNSLTNLLNDLNDSSFENVDNTQGKLNETSVNTNTSKEVSSSMCTKKNDDNLEELSDISRLNVPASASESCNSDKNDEILLSSSNEDASKNICSSGIKQKEEDLLLDSNKDIRVESVDLENCGNIENISDGINVSSNGNINKKSQEEIIGFLNRDQVLLKRNTEVTTKSNISVSPLRIYNLYRSFLKCRRFGHTSKDKLINYKFRSGIHDNPFLNKENLIAISSDRATINSDKLLEKNNEIISDSGNLNLENESTPVENIEKESNYDSSDVAEKEADEFMENYGHLLDDNFTIPAEILQQLGLSDIQEFNIDEMVDNPVRDNDNCMLIDSKDSLEDVDGDNCHLESKLGLLESINMGTINEKEICNSQNLVDRVVNENKTNKHFNDSEYSKKLQSGKGNSSFSENDLGDLSVNKEKEFLKETATDSINDSNHLISSDNKVELSSYAQKEDQSSSHDVPNCESAYETEEIVSREKISDCNSSNQNLCVSESFKNDKTANGDQVSEGYPFEQSLLRNMKRLLRKKPPIRPKNITLLREKDQFLPHITNMKVADFLKCVVNTAVKMADKETTDPATLVVSSMVDTVLKSCDVSFELHKKFVNIVRRLNVNNSKNFKDHVNEPLSNNNNLIVSAEENKNVPPQINPPDVNNFKVPTKRSDNQLLDINPSTDVGFFKLKNLSTYSGTINNDKTISETQFSNSLSEQVSRNLPVCFSSNSNNFQKQNENHTTAVQKPSQQIEVNIFTSITDNVKEKDNSVCKSTAINPESTTNLIENIPNIYNKKNSEIETSNNKFVSSTKETINTTQVPLNGIQNFIQSLLKIDRRINMLTKEKIKIYKEIKNNFNSTVQKGDAILCDDKLFLSSCQSLNASISSICHDGYSDSAIYDDDDNDSINNENEKEEVDCSTVSNNDFKTNEKQNEVIKVIPSLTIRKNSVDGLPNNEASTINEIISKSALEQLDFSESSELIAADKSSIDDMITSSSSTLLPPSIEKTDDTGRELHSKRQLYKTDDETYSILRHSRKRASSDVSSSDSVENQFLVLKRCRSNMLQPSSSCSSLNQETDKELSNENVKVNSNMSLINTEIKHCFVDLSRVKIPDNILKKKKIVIKKEVNDDDNESDHSFRTTRNKSKLSQSGLKLCDSGIDGTSGNVNDNQSAMDEQDVGAVWDSTVRVNAIKEYLDDLFIGSEDGRIFRLKSEGTLLNHVYSGHSGAVNCIAFFHDYLITGSSDGTVIFHRLSRKNEIGKKITVGGESDNVLAIHATREGPRRILIVAAKSQPLTIRDATSGLLLRSVNFTDVFYSLAFYSSTPYVYCGTRNSSVVVIDFITGEQTSAISLGRSVIKLIIKWDLIFTASYDGSVHVYSISKKKLIKKITVPGIIIEMELWNSKIILSTSQQSPLVLKFPQELSDYLEEFQK